MIHLPLDADSVNLSPSSLLNRSLSGLDRLLGELVPLPGRSMFLAMRVAPGSQACANPPWITIPNSIAPSPAPQLLPPPLSFPRPVPLLPHSHSASTSTSRYTQLQPCFFQASNPSSLAVQAWQVQIPNQGCRSEDVNMKTLHSLSCHHSCMG